jgi:malate dehydrogenase (oxaloacetate-decarboxylating)
LQEEEQGLKVKDLMTRNLTFVGADDSVMEAAKLMGEREISSVLVKGGEEFTGIITDRDIIGRVVSQGLDPRKVRVNDEVMSSPLITISGEETIEETSKKMREKAIRT